MKIISKHILVVVFLLTISNCLSAQTDSTSSSNNGVFFYPYVFYTPETKLAFGGGGIIFFRNGSAASTKPSKIVPGAFFTTNKQYSIDLSSEIYFQEEKYFITTVLGFGRYIRKFYGIGSTSPEIEKPEYKEKRFLADFIGYRTVNSTTKIGIKLNLDYHDTYDFDSNPFLYNKYAAQDLKGFALGIGAAIIRDNRDNLFFPSQGAYYELSATYFLTALGSDYDFNRYLINFRRYFSTFNKSVVAFQFYGDFVNGMVPFFQLPQLGGQYVMRGYFEGRYRDKKYMAFQSEIRTQLFWRIGFVAFAGIGDVAGRFTDYKLTKLKYSYGIGFRYRLEKKEKLDVRADFGFGKNTSGVYFGIEQAF